MVQAIAHGELLVDFVPTVAGRPLADVPTFQRAAGGAPGNVAVGLARLGVSAGFMGQVGADPFGRFLAATLADEGVDTSRLEFSPQAPTGLAFISLAADGERDFLFYRSPSADMLYAPDQIDRAYLHSADLLHVGSISLIAEPARAATLRALELAQDGGMTVSLDPNLRVNLWPGPEAAREAIEVLWPWGNIIKISEEELHFLAGDERGLTATARSLWHPQLRVLFVTQGRRGCTYFTEDADGHVDGFEVNVVDTTGAGDGFVAGALTGLLQSDLQPGDHAQMRRICRYANAVGALTTTQRGAIPALPSAEQVRDFLE